ncbi:hydrogenase nickel incorporation protein HypB [Desulfosporosinus meridiei]|uniref:Hydrogenase nickel incorporation protein HypB n=1 Tax=Desulfosporosinus meridiei (strain ATCC BAA-275 / DSM 13257 / KCTC 12902 / NCIMB 13706 / S10) TaxID=768704 RepID=J7IUZ9_DESMD|nr:hydrogenase nickel incorporation protein HypB [Desulfosporosinus meridiei]AFQ42933.1 Hydrogenase nickel incorporation protein HypB [Desulfosporosinus meridiei DSM 13257]
MELGRREIEVMANLLNSNDTQAEKNRAHFRKNNCLAINMIGSPGAGKTSLLEKSLPLLTRNLCVGVIEGDIFTSKDADRIAIYEVPVIQINTGGGCHLDSKMVNKVLPDFDWTAMDLMIIENVGNLVCPADFDLGEQFKVIVLSIVEGDDKPSKYPVIFRNAKAVILNKMDLEKLTDVNMESMKRDILAINPEIRIFEVSCRNGDGLNDWINWLSQQVNDYQEHKN